MEGGHDQAVASIYDKKNMPVILGDKDFKESALQRAQLSLQGGHPGIYAKPSAEFIVHQIGLLFDKTFEEITVKSVGVRCLNLARKLAIYSCQQLGDMKLREIAHYFKF